ncbi:DUF4232 domain-containing protein [Streptomyces sp. NPDC002825]|uniref:DUF4232 domain-containing protein n=1 Tax=Streptomyces sp. NPDC002825 TaxID=3154666 RepID=UPI0033168568
MNPRLSRLTLAPSRLWHSAWGRSPAPEETRTPPRRRRQGGSDGSGGRVGWWYRRCGRRLPGPFLGRAGARGDQAAGRCHTSELKADVKIQPDRPGSAMVMLVNKGTRTCTVFGYLGSGGLLADNSRVDMTTARVAQPWPPTQITLKPGTTAFSGLAWAPCGKPDASCRVLSGLVVTPPDETTQLTAAVLGADGKAVPQLTVSAAA